ncbi:MAG: right-handed parallel beta-helix repeat-containing protein [Bacteroidota bacterium]
MKIKHLLRPLFAALLCLQIINLYAQKNNSFISIDKFGGGKDAGKDATEAVKKALMFIKQNKSSKLVFPKGRYDFYPNQATEKYIFTSNNDESLKKIIFLLAGINNLEIDGQGSSFIFHGYVSPFVMENSVNISLKNFSIDWDRTFHSEGKIISVDNDGMNLTFSDKYPYKIENGILVFEDNNHEEYPYGSLLEFDPVKHETAYMANDYYFGHGQPAKEIVPGTVRLLAPGIKGTPGNVMVFNALKRLCSAITVADCRSLLFDSVNIYHCGGMGIVAQRSRNIEINHMNVTRSPGTDRVLSITADATHFVNCGGKLLIQNSLFENQMDDAANIHGIYVQVTKKLAAAKVEVRLKNEQQLGFDFIHAGSKLELVHNTDMEAYDTLIVKSATRINKEYTQVEFTKPLPAKLVIGKDVLAEVYNYPDVTIRHCIIQKNRARGMLIGSRGKVIIEDNLFHTAGAAILFEGDGSYWFEQAGVRDVTLRNNVFDNCNYGVWGNACIQVGSGVQKEYRNISRYNRNIKIYDNTFNVFDPRLLNGYSVKGLSFSNNKINVTGAYPNKFPGAKRFDLSDCSDLKIDGL